MNLISEGVNMAKKSDSSVPASFAIYYWYA